MKVFFYLLGIALSTGMVTLFDFMGVSIESFLMFYLIPLGALGIGYLSLLPLALVARRIRFNLEDRRWLLLIPHAVLTWLPALLSHYLVRGGSLVNFFTFTRQVLSFPLESKPLEVAYTVGWFDPVYYAIITLVGLYFGGWLCLYLRSEKADAYCTDCARYMDSAGHERVFTLHRSPGQGRLGRTEDFFLEHIRWLTVPDEVENGNYCGYMKPYRCPECDREKMRIRVLLRLKKKFHSQSTHYFPATDTLRTLYDREDSIAERRLREDDRRLSGEELADGPE